MNPLLAKYRCQDAQDINQYSPQILAYIGDAVYELCIRMRNTSSPFVNANRVHEETVEKVNAVFQAQLITTLTPYLTEKEQHVVRRGKNIKIQHPPGEANYREYRMATAFEALLGYLYLMYQEERILELIEIGLSDMSKGEGEA